jgi:uncharacterized cofD-like protein
MSSPTAEPLLSEIDVEVSGVSVVALGGGHGLAQALLAVQDYAGTITAVVSVADDGGSSGRLAPALGIPPPGDIRRALLALSPEPSVWKVLFEHRFEGGDISGHSMGNLMLAALAENSGSFVDALNTAGRLLGAKGAVLPATETRLTLQATIDGAVVIGQVAVALARGHLEELRLTPSGAEATPAAVRAIAAADQIVLGPGSLFTSIAACLQVPGIADAINRAKAKLVYVGNLTTQDGETLGMDVAAHVRALMKHTGVRCPDVVIAQEGPFEVPEAVEAIEVDEQDLTDLGVTVESADLADPEADWPQHHPARLGAVLRRLA